MWYKLHYSILQYFSTDFININFLDLLKTYMKIPNSKIRDVGSWQYLRAQI